LLVQLPVQKLRAATDNSALLPSCCRRGEGREAERRPRMAVQGTTLSEQLFDRNANTPHPGENSLRT